MGCMSNDPLKGGLTEDLRVSPIRREMRDHSRLCDAVVIVCADLFGSWEMPEIAAQYNGCSANIVGPCCLRAADNSFSYSRTSSESKKLPQLPKSLNIFLKLSNMFLKGPN